MAPMGKVTDTFLSLASYIVNGPGAKKGNLKLDYFPFKIWFDWLHHIASFVLIFLRTVEPIGLTWKIEFS